MQRGKLHGGMHYYVTNPDYVRDHKTNPQRSSHEEIRAAMERAGHRLPALKTTPSPSSELLGIPHRAT